MFSIDERFGFQDFFKQTLLSDRTENSVPLYRNKVSNHLSIKYNYSCLKESISKILANNSNFKIFKKK